MPDDREPITVLEGSIWRRNPPGREVVQVRRVWDWPGEGLTVRVHPVRGGKPLVAAAEWFVGNYSEADDDV